MRGVEIAQGGEVLRAGLGRRHKPVPRFRMQMDFRKRRAGGRVEVKPKQKMAVGGKDVVFL